MSEILMRLAALAPPTLAQSLLVVAVPSITMLMGSGVAFFARVPDNIQAATQNFSAGLLISAVAAELYPLMFQTEQPVGMTAQAKSSDVASTIAIGVGFLVGLAFMFGIEFLMDGEEEGEDKDVEVPEEKKEADLEVALLQKASSKSGAAIAQITVDASRMNDVLQRSLGNLKTRDSIDDLCHSLKTHIHASNRRLKIMPPIDETTMARVEAKIKKLALKITKLGSCSDVDEARETLTRIQHSVKTLHGIAECKPTRIKRYKSMPAIPEPDDVLKESINWTQVFTVTIDAAVDGLLIGLAFSASEGAGWAMAIATSIEMCFLGLSFSCGIQNETSSKMKHLAVVSVPPIVLLIAGVLGHFVGGLLEDSPLVFVGFIAFAVVALLFLVTQELLAEARETADSKLINSVFFVGLFGGILLSKFLG